MCIVLEDYFYTFNTNFNTSVLTISWSTFAKIFRVVFIKALDCFDEGCQRILKPLTHSLSCCSPCLVLCNQLWIHLTQLLETFWQHFETLSLQTFPFQSGRFWQLYSAHVCFYLSPKTCSSSREEEEDFINVQSIIQSIMHVSLYFI